jgi:hypothetical protein
MHNLFPFYLFSLSFYSFTFLFSSSFLISAHLLLPVVWVILSLSLSLSLSSSSHNGCARPNWGHRNGCRPVTQTVASAQVQIGDVGRADPEILGAQGEIIRGIFASSYIKFYVYIVLYKHIFKANKYIHECVCVVYLHLTKFYLVG